MHEGEIVGHMSLFFLRIKVGNQIIMGSQASDLVIHPDFRRQGMFLAIGRAMMKEAYEKRVWVTYGFPDPPAYHGHLQYGWFDVSMIPVMVSYSDIYEATKGKLGKFKPIDPIYSKLSKMVDKFYLMRQRSRKSGIDDLCIREISSFDKRIDEFWMSIQRNFGIVVIRNSEYLNWRYFQNPDLRYRVFMADDGKVQGFIVVAVEASKDRRIGYLLDIFSSSRNVLLRLLETGIGYLNSQTVDSIKCLMLKDYEGYKVLKEKGFTPFLHAKLRLCARVNSSHFFESYGATRKWYVTYGDCDFI